MSKRNQIMSFNFNLNLIVYNIEVQFKLDNF